MNNIHVCKTIEPMEKSPSETTFARGSTVRWRVWMLTIFLLGSCVAMSDAKEARLLGGFEKEEELYTEAWEQRPLKWMINEGGAAGHDYLSVFHATQGMRSLKVTFPGSERDTWPNFRKSFAGKDRDWSEFETLKIDVYNPEEQEIILKLRIDAPSSSLANPEKIVNFWGIQRLTPEGRTSWEINTGEIGEQVDIRNVVGLMIFLDTPRSDHTIFFDNIRLEGGEGETSGEEKVKPVDAFTQTAREGGGIPIARLFSAPKIDGVIDDPCWTRATRVADFVGTHGGETPVSEQTIAHLGYDEKNLYFAFICKESQMDKLEAKAAQRDTKVIWNDDCIEIFLDPGLVPERYYHFTVNSLGTQCDERWEHGIMFTEWGTGWQAKTSKGKDFWSLEVAIPFYILDFVPDTAFNWKINLCREEKPKGELSVLFPTFGGFHAPDKFGKLDGLNVNLNKYYYRITDLSLGKKKVGENRITFNVENGTGSAKEVLLQLDLTTPSGKSVSTQKKVFLNNGKNPVSLAYHLKEKGSYRISFSLTDAGGKDVFHASPSYTITPPPPLAISLMVPAYGNTIFATQEIASIKGKVSLNVEDSLKTGTIVARLLDKDNKSLAETMAQLKPEVDELETTLPVASLAMGDYKIEVSLVDEKHRQVASIISPLRKVGPHLDEVRINEDNNLIVNGKPFFPIGIWWLPEACYSEAREAGFNTVELSTVWAPAESYRPIFEKAKECGFWVAAQARFMGRTKDEKWMRNYIRIMKDFPNLLCWVIADETNAAYREPPEELIRIHQIVKEEDPHHPTRFNAYLTSEIGNYRKACDINGFDWYPIFNRGGECTTPLSLYANYVKGAISQVNNSQPVWVIASDIEFGRAYDTWHRRDRLPNYRENRCIAYICIISGAKSFWWWSYFWPYYDQVDEHSEWYGIKAVSKELSTLSPVFLSRSSSSEVKIIPEDKDIHFLLKEHQGDFYLLTANSSRVEKEITVSLPGLGDKKLRVVGEGRKISPANNTFQDSFSKYDVHVYTTSSAFPEIKLPRRIEAEEKRLIREEEARNQKNILTRLFFAEKGIFYKESSGKTSGGDFNTRTNNPSWATDGLKRTYWADGTPNKYPDWLEISLEPPQRIGRVVIYIGEDFLDDRSGLNSYELQYWKDGNWVAIARVENSSENKMVHAFQPLQISRLRVFITKSNGPDSIIQEIEAYEE